MLFELVASLTEDSNSDTDKIGWVNGSVLPFADDSILVVELLIVVA